MEKVALSNVQLDYLAYNHPTLGPVYAGTRPCDRLPVLQDRACQRAYIVNTDPHDEPGMHWVALWTDNDECEMFDSFSLPLIAYELAEPLKQWIERHYHICTSNAQSVQAVTSQTCGYYALFYLIVKSKGGTMNDFLSYFKPREYLWNDRVVGQLMREVIKKDGRWQEICNRCYSQCNK